jgi:hypothetical protein
MVEVTAEKLQSEEWEKPIVVSDAEGHMVLPPKISLDNLFNAIGTVQCST